MVKCLHPGGGEAARHFQFAEGSGPILIVDVDCTGEEVSLFQCAHEGSPGSFYTHEADVGVVCWGSIFDSTAT